MKFKRCDICHSEVTDETGAGAAGLPSGPFVGLFVALDGHPIMQLDVCDSPRCLAAGLDRAKEAATKRAAPTTATR